VWALVGSCPRTSDMAPNPGRSLCDNRLPIPTSLVALLLHPPCYIHMHFPYPLGPQSFHPSHILCQKNDLWNCYKIKVRKFPLFQSTDKAQYLAGRWVQWLSETTRDGAIDFLVRFMTTVFRFTHIFFISTISKVESFQRCSYVEIGTDLWASRKWAFKKYFQTAGEVLEQRGQVMGTFEQGEEADDSAATLYEYFIFIWQP